MYMFNCAVDNSILCSTRNFLGGVWDIHAAVLTSAESPAAQVDSIMCSVSSDGTLRIRRRRDAIDEIYLHHEKSHESTERGVFRLIDVEFKSPGYISRHCSSTSTNDDVVKLTVDTNPCMPPVINRISSPHLNKESIAKPQVALHAVHSCEVFTNGNHCDDEMHFPMCDSACQLVACGGAAGLIRLQIIL